MSTVPIICGGHFNEALNFVTALRALQLNAKR
jgi:hypothetical protein